MSEYDEINFPSKDKVKGKVNQVVDGLNQDRLNETAGKAGAATGTVVATAIEPRVLQIVTCVAVVGILINNRRSLKFTKKVVQNMDRNMLQTQNTIKTLKEAGKTFEFYPGVGLWVH